MSAYDFLQAHAHEVTSEDTPDDVPEKNPPPDDPGPEPSDTLLINASLGSRPVSLPPGYSPSYFQKLQTFHQPRSHRAPSVLS
jgi:hypothetical protein